jgi:hypothetical protein
VHGEYLSTLLGASAEHPLEDSFLFCQVSVESRPCVETDFADISGLGEEVLEERNFIGSFGHKLRMEPERHTNVPSVLGKRAITRPSFGCGGNSECRDELPIGLCDQGYMVRVEI